MRALVTGQVGLDKAEYLEHVRVIARANGVDLQIYNVGEMMYREAPDVPAGRILNLPITRLNALRRAAFKEIMNLAQRQEHVIVNTHATFRWRHGLFAAFDFDQIRQFKPDLYVTLLDNAEAVHQRLSQDHEIDHTLRDIMVWREEELLATEIIASSMPGHGRFFMLARGRSAPTAQTLYRLLFEPQRKRAYLSFPITHVMDLPNVLAQIGEFKATLQEQLTCFDPADVDEYGLYAAAEEARAAGRPDVEVISNGNRMTFKTEAIAQISRDILGQIYARDFKMIDQSDMIVSLVPQLPSGRPALSSGVERELHHAFETGKEVYVVWQCKAAPSVFVSETATAVFPDTASAIEYFRRKGYLTAGGATGESAKPRNIVAAAATAGDMGKELFE